MPSSAPESVRILYVGQNADIIAILHQQINNHECEEHGSIGAPAKLELIHPPNQKIALRSIRNNPPNIVLIEMDGKPNRRLAFCDMLRYRLPKAALIAICLENPQTPFQFDGKLKMPLQPDDVVEYLCDRATQFNGNQLEQGHIKLNIAKRVVSVNREQYGMTPKQCALLNMLMTKHNSVVTRKEIMEEIWETSFMEDTRTLDVHIRWLRERIEKNPSKPKYLVTVRGVGYRLTI